MNGLPDFSNHFPVKEGFCRPDWRSIGTIIENQVSETEREQAWKTVSRRWMEQLCREFGGYYQLFETANFLILTEAPERNARDACNSYEAALKQLLASLAGIASDTGFGKHVVLMFSSLDQYYRYIAYFYPEGEHPLSGGVCLYGEGYVHFAFPTADHSSYRSVLVHELTHGCLVHLRIPLWLNEALAMRMEEIVCRSSIFVFDTDLHERKTGEKLLVNITSASVWETSPRTFSVMVIGNLLRTDGQRRQIQQLRKKNNPNQPFPCRLSSRWGYSPHVRPAQSLAFTTVYSIQ